MNTKTEHLVSIGHLCEQFQRGYFDLLQTLADLGVKPTLTLNLVPYYDFQESYRVLDPNPPTIRGTDNA